jgi:hypothetical protein
MEKPAVNTGTVFQPTTDIFFHSPIPEKSSVPWRETFYIPPCRKSLVLGARSEAEFLDEFQTKVPVASAALS